MNLLLPPFMTPFTWFAKLALFGIFLGLALVVGCRPETTSEKKEKAERLVARDFLLARIDESDGITMSEHTWLTDFPPDSIKRSEYKTLVLSSEQVKKLRHIVDKYSMVEKNIPMFTGGYAYHHSISFSSKGKKEDYVLLIDFSASDLVGSTRNDGTARYGESAETGSLVAIAYSSAIMAELERFFAENGFMTRANWRERATHME